MRKRIVISMLTFTMLAFSVGGCAGGKQTTGATAGNDESSTEVSAVASSGTDYELESGNIDLKVWGAKEDMEVLQSMCQSFAEEYKSQATFTFEFEEVPEGESQNKMLADMENAPDVFSFADQPRAFVAAGAISPVPDPEKIKTSNIEGAVEAAIVNDTVYGYPMTADNGYFLFYNSKYLSEEDVKSLDRILEVAAANGKKMTYEITSGWYLYSFFGRTGLTVGMNDDGVTNYCTWNSTENAIKGTDVASALISLSKTPGFLCGGNDELVEGARNDTVIAGVNGMWNAETLKEIWGENFAAAKLPTYTCAGQQVQLGSFTGYKLYGVNAYSEHVGWSHKLADWLTNEDNQMLRLQVRGLGPANKTVFESDAVQNSIALRAFIEQSEHSDIQSVGGTYWIPTADFGTQIINGELNGVDLQAVMDELVAGITELN